MTPRGLLSSAPAPADRLQGNSMMPMPTDTAFGMVLSDSSAAQPCGNPEIY